MDGTQLKCEMSNPQIGGKNPCGLIHNFRSGDIRDYYRQNSDEAKILHYIRNQRQDQTDCQNSVQRWSQPKAGQDAAYNEHDAKSDP